MSGLDGLRLLLRSVALGEAETVDGLARRSGIARSTLFDLMGPLAAAGFVERDSAGHLRAGPGCGRLGFAAAGLAPAYPVAEALLPALRDDTDGTVVLSTDIGEGEIVLAQRRAPWHVGPFSAEAAIGIDIEAPPHRKVARLALQLRPDTPAAEREQARHCLARVAAAMTAALGDHLRI